MIVKLKIVEKKEHCYILQDNKKVKYNIPLEIYGDNIPEVGDIIYAPEFLIKEINIYAYGPLNGNYCRIDKENDELIKIISKDKEYYLQRYYG